MTEEIIVKELAKAGILINEIYDLVNTNKSYPSAIPVLIKALEAGVENRKVKEGVIRALAVKEAKGKANEQLFEEYYKTQDPMLKWTIGNTLSVLITENDLPKILKIVLDKKNGISRQMFVLSMGKIKAAEDCLIQLLQDEEVTPHALDALSRLKSKKAFAPTTALLKHPKPLIRKEAEKALKKINKI
jgi:hypothetical protein